MKFSKSIVLAALVGGLILFASSTLSWKSVYWKGIIVKNFKDERAVERVMRENAPESGVYVMPNIADADDVAKRLPVIFTGINLEGKRPLAFVVLASIVAKILMAFVAIWLLLHHDTRMPYGKRVGFFVLMGCIIAAGAKLSFLIKGYYSVNFALYSMFAVICQWLLAGLAMAKIVKHK